VLLGLPPILAWASVAAGQAADRSPPPFAGERAEPLYHPFEAHTPERRIGAGTRGQGRFGSLLVLAPDHLGFTTRAQPTLYWYLAAPTATRIDVTLRDEESVAPLLEVTLPTPTEAGVQAVRLADYGVHLRADTSYAWFVSLVVDGERRSHDFSVGGWIRRRDAGDARTPNNDASALARAGLWYDALDAASAAIAGRPGDPAARALRAELLDEVGLSEVAAVDRRALAAPVR
jgi:hypothetical protein